MKLPVHPDTVKGFLDAQEGAALYEQARNAPGAAPCLEIGSYCGKSTLYLGCGCAARGAVLFSVDHHRGSEEHQPGEEYHDAELLDAKGRMDSFPAFRDTLARAALEDTVVPVVAASTLAARAWKTPLALVFIDGGHSRQAAHNDYHAWHDKLLPGGLLAIHDIFPNPADGGQAPYEIWQTARASGMFEELALIKTLGLLRRAR